MFKELNNITTRGLINETENGKTLYRDVWNDYFSDDLNDDIYNYIMSNCIYDNEYKYVDEKLEQLIGIYPINVSTCMWNHEFIQLFNDWCSNNNIYDHLWFQNDTTTSRKQYQELNGKLINADFCDGYIIDGTRKIKILKYIKQNLKKIYKDYKNEDLSDTIIETADWYKLYVAKKQTNNQLYLVITNSIASQLGMSSYAQNHQWGSCQTIHDCHDGYARCIHANLTDQGSLICYITDGSTITFEGRDDYEHHAMITRWMLRLLKTKTGDYIVALDRAYPDDRFSIDVMHKILDLCKENDLLFSIHYNYNSSQNEQYESYNSLIKNKETVYAYSSHRIKFATSNDNKQTDCEGCSDYRNRDCPNCHGDCKCDWDEDRQYCCNCNMFDDDCVNRDCADCEWNCIEHNDDDVYHPHYDDQGRGANLNRNLTNYNDCTYKHTYTLFHPIDFIEKKPLFIAGDIVEYINTYSISYNLTQGVVTCNVYDNEGAVDVSWFNFTKGWSKTGYPSNSMHAVNVRDIKFISHTKYEIEEDDVA